MKISLSWLLEHIELNPIFKVNMIGEVLTNLGLEVESINNTSLHLREFLIGQVLKVEQHPNADRLKLCRVNIGNKSCNVICGAPNVVKSMKVVFAPLGVTIPSSGMVLKKKEIRGIIGEGMLCSEEELGIGGDSSGIIKLPNTAPVGESYSNWAGISDYILDIAITPNRGDCASVRGIARELASVGCGTLIKKSYQKIKGNYPSPIKWEIELDKDNKHLVPYVKGRHFKGLKNTASPEWLKRKMISIGLKPISALVDLTNYFTLDLGRPLHVFDAKKIKGNLKMRMAKNKEKIFALDGNEYNLNDKNLIIADDLGPLSIAGVIGGINSGCDFQTTEMFLESALFDKNAIAYNGRSLNIISDARYRFERGIDPHSVDYGLDVMTKMVLEICGGEVSKTVDAGLLKIEKASVRYRTSQLSRIGGIDLDKSSQKAKLEKLGFRVSEKKDFFNVLVPPWRHDIDGESDLVEEILRVNGYNKISNKFLSVDLSNFKPALSLNENRAKIARDTLARRGLVEDITFSFLSQKDAKMFGVDSNCLTIDNPISEDFSVMRPSLIPNLINNLSKNIRNGFFNNGIFEVSSVFLGTNKEDQKICVSAVREGLAEPRHWAIKERNVDIYDIKADALEVLSALGVNENKISLLYNAPTWYHPGRSGSFNLGKFTLGYFGEIHPKLKQYYKMKPVFFEVFPENIPGKNISKPKTDFSFYNFMPFRRDFAFLVDKKVMSYQIVNCVKKIGINSQLVDVLEVSIFDVYEDDMMKNKKSLAIEVFLQPLNDTLNEKEIAEISNHIVTQVNKETGAILRK